VGRKAARRGEAQRREDAPRVRRFTYFTDRVRDKLGFDYAYSNNLDIEDAKLVGTVSGPLVDAGGKAAHVVRIRKELGLARWRVIAIGDGATTCR